MKNKNFNLEQKAKFYFLLIIFINLVVLSFTATGIIIGIKEFVLNTKSTYESITCCKNICLKCLFTLRTFSIVFPWICIILFFVGIFLSIHKAILIIASSKYFINSIASAVTKNISHSLKNIILSLNLHNKITILANKNSYYAFTTGLWRPKIYLSKGICSYLTTKELTAVILHELHHKENNVPLKLFLINILCTINFFIPINKYLLKLFSSTLEKAADDSAISLSKEPLELASALVKLSKTYSTNIPHPAIPFFNEQAVVEDRITRLLGIPTNLLLHNKINMYISYTLSFIIISAVYLSLFFEHKLIDHAINCKTLVCHMIRCS
ncbi:MAG TPA: M56 family metallopeptidase [Candidatus Wujingus californicus]|uniref:M56 family metallopeptidase n=1 Tax=Candidatus Wujingus californicus TaxID=3367618 RepID=UPI001D3E9C96|nr:M56 family metallopeptidase [Planctomycetota bacterium]